MSGEHHESNGTGLGKLPHKEPYNRQPPQETSRAYAARDFKEVIRSSRRYIYSYEDWVLHRATGRHWVNIMTIWTSEIFRGLIKPALIFTMLAVCVGVYTEAAYAGLLPSWLPFIAFGVEPFSMSGGWCCMRGAYRRPQRRGP